MGKAAFAADFQATTYTASNQLEPAVARAANGDFVVVWGSGNQDGQFYGIFAQRFSSTGARIAVEFQVNTYTTNAQRLPAVAMNDAGAFVVVWRSGSQDGSDYGVFGRRFSSTGAGQGVEFQVNAYTTAAQNVPAVAIDDQGDFVVVWQGTGAAGAGIFGRRFGSNGGALASDFKVNTSTLNGTRYPAVASDADGDFVVTWDSRDQDGPSYGTFARRFDSLGVTTGGEFQVNTHTISDQFLSTVAAADDGAFVVAWQSYHDGSGAGVFARRFSSSGAPLAVEFQVGQRTTLQQIRPSIDVAGDGAFLVAWTDSARDGSDYGVFGRRFDSTGAALSSDFQVNSYTLFEQRLPAVHLADDSAYVVAWHSPHDGFGFGVFATLKPALVTLDVDGDGTLAPLTDGLLVLRDHFGFSGSTLTNGAVDADCTRCDGPSVTAYINALGLQLDIDGNGSLDALTDGLLVLRNLFGFTGTTLTAAATGAGCTRCNAAQIEPYLNTLKTTPPTL
ncbi:MAG TPA: hypothetical protein VHR17_04150 [Thermoanaerobaculia bacterium]|nr:hypothetical protein [Thermoanaerobaculia bacterium]